MSDENNKLLKEILQIILGLFYGFAIISIIGFIGAVAMIIYHW